MKIIYLGQCGFLFENENVKFAIDPVLNDIYDDDGNNIRLYPAVMKPEMLEVDYIFCTHEHIDHMDIPTLKQCIKAHPDIDLIVPKGSVSLLVNEGICENNIIGILDAEKIKLNSSLTVTGISTAHPEHKVDENGMDQNLAYNIECDGKRYVHLGDTYITNRLYNSLKDIPDIDILFAPINGRDEEREAIGIIGNMSCEEVAKLSDDLKVKCTVPMHFDMVVGNTEDPQKFVEELYKLDDKANYWIPKLNQIYKC